MTQNTTTSATGIQTRVLTVTQWAFGLYFILVGTLHFIVPDGLPGPLSWMYELSDQLHYVAGGAEILGGLGLILPGLTGIAPRLTAAAATGLVIVMLGAVVWHAGRGELSQITVNTLLAAISAYVAYSTRNPRTPERT